MVLPDALVIEARLLQPAEMHDVHELGDLAGPPVPHPLLTSPCAHPTPRRRPRYGPRPAQGSPTQEAHTAQPPSPQRHKGGPQNPKVVT